MQLDFTAKFSDNAWYPTVDLTGFKSRTGIAIDVKEKMVLTFTAPGKITEGDITVSTAPWREIKLALTANEIAEGINDIHVVITAADGGALGGAIAQIHMGVNVASDAAPAWSSFKDTFIVAADEEASAVGELMVNCAQLPAGLEGMPLELTLVRGEQREVLHPAAGVNVFSLAAGTWRATAAELRTPAGTVRAAVNVSVADVVINPGKRTQLDITFATVVRSTTVDIAIDLPAGHALYSEALNVVFVENGVETRAMTMKSGEKKRLEHLSPGGQFAVKVQDVRLNNVRYCFSAAEGALDNQFHEVVFSASTLEQSDDTQTGSAALTLDVRAEKSVPARFALRLMGEEGRQYLFANLPMQSQRCEQPVTLAQGSYRIVAETVICDGVLHYVDVASSTLDVDGRSKQTLAVTLTPGANLRVKGFPDFLSFGGCADMQPSNVDDLAEARVSSLFKYAGDDGMGDASGYLDPAKEPTGKIIEMARDVSAKTHESVLPVMVSYTCNLSLGDVENIIDDPVRHTFSFANFIQALQMAQAMKDDAHPVPAGFIVNPDYLGECQKYGFSPDYPIPVRQPLTDALAHHGVDIAVPAGVTDTLKGYIKGVNWLVRAVAPDVTLGWQLNLWSVGGSQWLYSDFTYDDVFDPADGIKKKMTINPALAGKLCAQYALLVGVFEDIDFVRQDGTKAVAKGADFMAVDRYEADDFTSRAYMNGYCYSPYEWDRTFDFCASLSRHLRQPVMPWQMPASRLATVAESVGELNEQFWGTGGSYMMGHPEIGSSVAAINPRLMAVEFLDAHATMMGPDALALFSRHRWDFSTPKYFDFPSRGIFHVQVGGGATTGVVSGVNRDSSRWMRAKLKAYRDNPVIFKS